MNEDLDKILALLKSIEEQVIELNQKLDHQDEKLKRFKELAFPLTQSNLWEK